jgi:cysteine-rich repeat protein
MRDQARSRCWASLLLGMLALGCGRDGKEQVTLRDAGHAAAEPSGALDDGEALGGSVRGVVADVRGDRLALALVVVGEHATQSDERGEFVLAQLPLGAQTLVTTRPGYSGGSVPLQLSSQAQSQVRVVLQPAEQAELTDPTAGGSIVTEAGAVLEFPPGAIVDERQELVALPVEVAVALIDDRDEMTAAPGGMLAQGPDDSSLERFQMESFGMLEVTLRAGGELVRLRDGSEIGLSFPMVAHHPWSEGDALDTWFFDAADHVWKAAGQGVVGPENRFETRVTHPLYWSAGVIQSNACVRGRLATADGEAIAAVDLTAEGRSYLGSSHVSSDDAGHFCLEARAASVVELSGLCRVNDAEHVVAVRLNMPGESGSCAEPDGCFALGDDLVAVESPLPLCVARECPPDPDLDACCRSDLGPCGYVVAGDCGDDGSRMWDEPATTPGLESIAGVPQPPAQDAVDAGTSRATDAGLDAAIDAATPAATDAATVPGEEDAQVAASDACSGAIALQPGGFQLPDLELDAGPGEAGLVFSIALPTDRVLRVEGVARFDGSVALLDPNRCDVLADTRTPFVAGTRFAILLGSPGLPRTGETGLAPALVRVAAEGDATEGVLEIGSVSLLAASCGDGVLSRASSVPDPACDAADRDGGASAGCGDLAEGCDDRNTVDGDGCSADCAIETRYICDGQPSRCVRPAQ